MSRRLPRILLVGGGHANLLAVQPLKAALPDARIILIDPTAVATYSGMVPGVIAGDYDPAQAQVDLPCFAARHGIRFRLAAVTAIDPQSQSVTFADGGSLSYDLAVLDIGSHAAMPEIDGFADHAVPIKPLHGFVSRLEGLPAGAPAAVIGGGVAGAEVALALRQTRPVTLIEKGPEIASALAARTRARLQAALARAGVVVLTNATVAQVTGGAVVLADERHLPADLTIGIAGARAHDWVRGNLPVDPGDFVRVGSSLQVEGHPSLFAVGDCAAMTDAPRPKAGVFAVRQAPVLVRNLVALQHGQPLVRYLPQKDYLKIISLGDRTALAEWQGVPLQGRWLWHLKDRIDRRFLRTLNG